MPARRRCGATCSIAPRSMPSPGSTTATAIFPIHRSTRFVLLTCTAGQPTQAIRCRFGITRDRGSGARRRGCQGDDHDDTSLHPAAVRRRRSRHSRTLDAARPRDRRTHQRACSAARRSGGLGRAVQPRAERQRRPPCIREVHGRIRRASDRRGQADRTVPSLARSMPPAAGSDEPSIRRALPQRARLAYRDVASATNRLTLIAAIIPARAVTTHTLFCLRTRLPMVEQHVLCALLNSFVANYLIRLQSEYARHGHAHVASPGSRDSRRASPFRATRRTHRFARARDEAGRGNGGIRAAAGSLRARISAEGK